MTVRIILRALFVALLMAGTLLRPSATGALPALTTCALSGTYVLTAALSFEGIAGQFAGQFTFTPGACVAGTPGTAVFAASVLFAGSSTPLVFVSGFPYTVDANGGFNIAGLFSGAVAGVTDSGVANLLVFDADQTIVPTTTRFGGTAARQELALPPPGPNPQLVGTLRWDQLPRGYGDFPAGGTGPFGVAFDGANLWVANFFSDNVTKLRASDGANLGTFPVGNHPVGVAFDGTNIWVANSGSNNVTKLRVSDGTPQGGPFAVGTFPTGVAFDGANIWVANGNSNDVTKLRASDGAPLGTFSAGNGPRMLAFDGANIWVTNLFSNNVTKLRASDGASQPGSPFPVGINPFGVAFDGANIWVASSSGDVTKLQTSDGTPQGGPIALGGGANGVAFDGTNIWVTTAPNLVTKLRASDGANLGTVPVGTGPRLIAFDGAHIWVTNFTDNTVSER